MYDGNLDPLEEVDQFLENETFVNDEFKPLPETPQDETPHNDGLHGRVYEAEFDQNEVGRTGLDVLNTFNDGDHYDTVERDPATGNMYKNRIYDPINDTGLDTGFDPDPGLELDGGFGPGL
jgi:hypothetical protein